LTECQFIKLGKNVEWDAVYAKANIEIFGSKSTRSETPVICPDWNRSLEIYEQFSIFSCDCIVLSETAQYCKYLVY